MIGKRPCTSALALVALLCYISILIYQPDAAWYQSFALSRYGILRGELWQIFTHALIHGSWTHLALNLAIILALGGRIEKMLGSWGFWRLAMIGVFCGGIFHLCLGSGLLVGISGCCMAMVLFLTTQFPQRSLKPLRLSGRSLGRGILVSAFILALVNPDIGIPVLSSLGSWLRSLPGLEGLFQVGHACHLGGASIGFLVAKRFMRSRYLRDEDVH